MRPNPHDQDHHRRQGNRRSARIYAPPSLRGCRRRNPAVLFPRAAVDRRQLPDVPRRGERRAAEADRVLRDGGEGFPPRPEWRAAGRPHQFANGAQGAQGHNGVPAHQPSARLPDLRPGRRMRPAGSGDGLWRRLVPVLREQARCRRQIYRSAGQDLDEPLHPMHALRALRDRGRGGSGARRDRPRRGHGDHVLSRAGADLGVAGERRRPLPGRSLDLETDRVPFQAVGIRQDRIDRRHGRAGLGDPGRFSRPRGRAHPAAHQ